MSDHEAISDPAPRPSPRHRRRRWRSWLAALLIFASGVVVGGGGMLGMIHRRIVEHHQKPPGHATDHITRRLERRLRLDPEQTARVRDIVKQRLLSLRAIRDESMPRVLAELSAAREEIAAELTPDQAVTFRKHFSRLEEMLPPIPAAGARGEGPASSP